MRNDIVNLISKMKEKLTLINYSKAEYQSMTKGLLDGSCKFHEPLSTPKKIDEFLIKHSDTKHELTNQLFEFMDLIEQLDTELREELGRDDNG